METKKDEWLLRIFARLQKLNEQRHLYSIRTAFIATMPVMIVGAYAVVVNNMPIPAYQHFMQSLFGEGWRVFGALAFNATTQIVTLFVVFNICANLANWYNANRRRQIHGGICGMVGLACYVVVSLPVQDAAGVPFGMVGATGLFVGMLTGIVSAEVFIRLCGKNARGLLSDDPNVAVPQSFSAIVPTIVVIGGFVLLRMLLVWGGVTQGFSEIVNDLLRAPYENNIGSVPSAVLYNISTHIMWLFGIHGNNVLDGVAQTVFAQNMAANVAAAAAGSPPAHLLTKTFFDAFVYMGGSGTTLALVLALFLFGKGRSHRRLMRYALPNALFNINEPLVFGIPIVLNPVYAVPFVLTPVVMFGATAAAMALGLVPYTTAEVSWAAPVLVSGYMATGSAAGAVMQVVNLVLAVAIYAPFVRLSERLAALRFEEAYRELVALVTTEYAPASRQLILRVDEVGAVARRLAGELDSAMKDGEMFMVYQPIVDAKHCRLHSVEALLRWKHPLHGFVNPMVAVALAEETGLVDRLGLWILEQAMAQRAQWTQAGLGGFHVSVNVSSQQLNVPNFHEHVKQILARHRVPPGQLQVEITETVALVENTATRQNLLALSGMGATIAMDDFGVGHSSLLYLRTMPITTLKIDGSLSREVVSQPANLDIIATIFDLCRLLGVGTVIEYVDNEEQLGKLRSVGVFLIQGYLFSPPITGPEVAAYAKKMEALKNDGKDALCVREMRERTL